MLSLKSVFVFVFFLTVERETRVFFFNIYVQTSTTTAEISTINVVYNDLYDKSRKVVTYTIKVVTSKRKVTYTTKVVISTRKVTYTTKAAT